MTTTPDLRDLALDRDAVLWRNSGDLRTSVVSVRALVLQVAYPMVGAGVGEHSVYKTDPWGRLYRSLKSLMTQIYGSERAVAEGRRLQELHRGIKGVDAQGRRYSALNPEAFYWVHATVLEGALVFQEKFDRPLSADEVDRIYDEWRRVGLMLGLRESDLPADIDGFWRRWDDIRSRLENNPVVQDVLHNGPKKPRWLPLPQRWLDALNRPAMKLQRDIATWTLDDDLCETFGLAPLTAAERRRLERLARITRLLGRLLPDPVRFPLPIYIARRRAMARTPTPRQHAA
ncbi:MAG: oxygenase MpaB family protein [Marmoricola sp.]